MEDKIIISRGNAFAFMLPRGVYRIGLTYAFPVSKGGGELQRLAAFGCALQMFFFKYLPHTFYFSSPRGGMDQPQREQKIYSCLFSLVHVQVHTINNNNVGKGKREKSAFLRICLISRCHTYMDLWGKLY